MTPPESLDIAEQKRRFHWQCRRGASEVEVVLNAYLERFFEVDDDERRAEQERRQEQRRELRDNDELTNNAMARRVRRD